MIYRDFQGMKISQLAMGCMRLPVVNEVYADINEEQTAQMVELARSQGVNYFDTAWGYHDGQSEIVMGKVLAKYPRESFFLADKFPGYDPANWDKVEEVFEEQLKKAGVDYFDFYLFHNVCEMNIDAYLDDEQYGIYSYLMEQKKNGRIKHLGFSVHGTIETTQRFLDAYGKDMEFCQIQLNWMDWKFQNARKKVKLLNEMNIPVWVMEPLRGGKLATLPDAQMEKLEALRPGVSAVEWSLRYLQSFPEVVTVLSGASNLDQMKQNAEIFQEDKPLTEAELMAIYEVAAEMTNASLPCTACRYCTKHCEQGLDIPRLIELYNQRMLTGEGDFISLMALSAIPADKQPSACIACGKCETVCPQQIKISEAMANFARAMGQTKEESAE